jgi:xanthine dehydrogenase accessory factor
MRLNELKFIIKSAGEMGSGIAWRLYRAGFKRIVMLDIAGPMAVRRSVCFCEAIYDGVKVVDTITAVAARTDGEIEQALEKAQIPVVVDHAWQTIAAWKPQVVIDAILAKQNLGTHIEEAELVIGLGPGFSAGVDAHVVIETNRGANCGRLIYKGCAEKNTGIPGSVMGHGVKRVVRAPARGNFNAAVLLDDTVEVGDCLGTVVNQPVLAEIGGNIRGLIRDKIYVEKGVKIGDIEPRAGVDNSQVSDKSLAIAGAVFEAVLSRYND